MAAGNQKSNPPRSTRNGEAARSASAASGTIDMAQEGAASGSDLARTSVQAMQEMVQSGMSMAAQVAQRSTDRFAWPWGLGGDSRSAMDQSRRTLEAMVECGHVLTRGLQEAQREWLELARDRAGKNLDGFGALLRCRTPQDVLAAQSALARGNLEFLLGSGRRMAEISAGLAEEAQQKISPEGAEQDRKGRRAA